MLLPGVEVGAGAGESKCGGSAGIERVVGIDRQIGVCGDDIAEVFAEKESVGFEAGFPFVPGVMDGDAGVEVSLFEVVMQEGGDGPGAVVGIEPGGVIAHHATKVGEDIGRKDVLVRSDTHRLEIAGGLELRRCARGILQLRELLEQLVGDFVARKFVADAEGETVLRGEIALIA